MKLHRSVLLVGSMMGAIGLANVAQAQTSAAAFTMGHRYDLAGRELGTIRPPASGAVGPFLAVRNTFDAAGRLIKVEEGSLSSWQAETVAPFNWNGFTAAKSIVTSYDAQDRKTIEAVLDSSGSVQSVTQYSYNAIGLLECTAVRMNPSVYGSLPSSACSLGTEGSAGPDRITKNVYDAAGQLVQVRKGVGTPLEQAYVTYAYNANGKQTDVIDANGNRATYTYDGFDRLVQWNFPSTTKPTSFNGATQATALSSAGSANSGDYEAYAYDANGNRTSFRKRDGSILGYTYDALNRVTVKAVPSRSGLGSTHTRSVYYSYDLQGHQLTAQFDSTGGEGVINTFDGFGRQLTSAITMDGATRTVSYQYDANGNRTRVTYPDGNYVTYNYDGLDRPSSILRSGSATVASYGYNADGTRASFNGGVNTSYGYDTIGRLTSLTNTPGINTSYANTYGFGYNPASQTTSLSRSNNSFIFNGLYNVNRNYTTNGLNQYTAAGSASFTYDANGNLTSDGTTTFLYDIENRLVNAGGAKNAQLRYDPLGRLYEISGPTGTTRFLYDGDALIGEYDGSGNLLRRYIHGADMKSDDPIAWYEGGGFDGASERMLRPDWQGSIALVTDNAGSNIYAVNTYDEYGIPGSSNTGRFQYTGQAWTTELGMYYYKARFYSPTLGRFLQTDPIGYKDQVNLYAYVGNSPINGIDPTGQDSYFFTITVAPATPFSNTESHGAIAVVSKDGGVRIIDYGPQSQIGGIIPSGNLINESGNSNAGVHGRDTDAFKNETFNDKISLTKMGISDQSVISAASVVDQHLGNSQNPGSLTYSTIPGVTGNGANSNSAIGAVIAVAGGMSGLPSVTLPLTTNPVGMGDKQIQQVLNSPPPPPPPPPPCSSNKRC